MELVDLGLNLVERLFGLPMLEVLGFETGDSVLLTLDYPLQVPSRAHGIFDTFKGLSNFFDRISNRALLGIILRLLIKVTETIVAGNVFGGLHHLVNHLMDKVWLNLSIRLLRDCAGPIVIHGLDGLI
jgi:hypothetical protein